MIRLMVRLSLKKYDKIVISPGPGKRNQAGNCLKIVKEVYKKIPVLLMLLSSVVIDVLPAKII